MHLGRGKVTYRMAALLTCFLMWLQNTIRRALMAQRRALLDTDAGGVWLRKRGLGVTLTAGP